jgi:hypothetical protein
MADDNAHNYYNGKAGHDFHEMIEASFERWQTS